MTRQQKWQEKMAALKKCIVCGGDLSADSVRLCDYHLAAQSSRSRAKYRKKHGIPLDSDSVRGKHLKREEKYGTVDRQDSESGTDHIEQ